MHAYTYISTCAQECTKWTCSFRMPGKKKIATYQMAMHSCIRAFTHSRIHAFTHSRIRVRPHKHEWTYARTHINMYARTRTHMRSRARTTHARTRMHNLTHALRHVRTCTCMHTGTPACAHCMHGHMLGRYQLAKWQHVSRSGIHKASSRSTAVQTLLPTRRPANAQPSRRCRSIDFAPTRL